jgi:sarcosine oxidase subunit gamma
VAVRLTGPAPDAVLARLVPVDLRPLHFAPGHVARTLLGHVAVLIHRPATAPEALEVWLPRSMAAHALDDLAEAMRAVAAR